MGRAITCCSVSEAIFPTVAMLLALRNCSKPWELLFPAMAGVICWIGVGHEEREGKNGPAGASDDGPGRSGDEADTTDSEVVSGAWLGSMKHTSFGPDANFTFLFLLEFDSTLGFFRIPTGLEVPGGLCLTGTLALTPVVGVAREPRLGTLIPTIQATGGNSASIGSEAPPPSGDWTSFLLFLPLGRGSSKLLSWQFVPLPRVVLLTACLGPSVTTPPSATPPSATSPEV